ncbi:MAG: hypothetical protein N3E37_04055 [Candidatus Micrarchaeota archaeon]|nr:hypothetical protein [Candidatus Micrarchaeota archaeon]
MTDKEEKEEYSNLPSWMRKKGVSVDKSKTSSTIGSSADIKPTQTSSNVSQNVQQKQTSTTTAQQQSFNQPQQQSLKTSSSYEQIQQKERTTQSQYQEQQMNYQQQNIKQMPNFQPYEYAYKQPVTSEIPAVYKIGLAVAIVVALIALYFAWSSYNYVMFFKGRIQTLAKQLSEINDQEIEFTIPDASYKAKISKDVPVNTLFTGPFGVPVEMNIPIDTRLTAYTTTGIPVSLNIKDNLFVKDIARIDPKSLNSNIVVKIETDIKGTTPIIGKTRLKDLYGDKIKNITKELEELSK